MRTTLKHVPQKSKKKMLRPRQLNPGSKASILLVFLRDVEKYKSELIKIADAIEKYLPEVLNLLGFTQRTMEKYER